MIIQATYIKTPVLNDDRLGTALCVQKMSYPSALLGVMHDPECKKLRVIDTNLSREIDASSYIPQDVAAVFRHNVAWLYKNCGDPKLSVVEFSFETTELGFQRAISQLSHEFAAKNRRVEKDFNVSPMFHLRASQSGNIFVAIGHEAPNVLSIVDAKPPVAIGVDAKPK
jgi:hypothetical protein